MFSFLKKNKPAPAAVEDAPDVVPEIAPEALVPDEVAVEIVPDVVPEQASASAQAIVPEIEPEAEPELISEVEPGAAPEPAPEALAAAETPKTSWRDRLFKGLAKTRAQWGGKLKGVFSRGKVDDQLLEELETLLLTSDVGIEATTHLLEELKKAAKRDKADTPEGVQKALAGVLVETLQPLEEALDVSSHKPFVIMIAGVNGAGKTTSIGKLAKYYQNQGKSVLLAAGDTFRAAAREQLETWGRRNNVTVIAQDNGDPAAVVFDAISAAKARGIDIVLADTAGRLPTQLHLMEEIAKVRRVIQKIDPSGPHETLLVLDANIGQNALQQVKAFDKAISVTGLILTKLDGTARGGVVMGIARQCPKPIRFIGVGEQIDDLRPFSARDFVDALFG